MTTSEILSHLRNVKQNGNGWMASCPAHDDGNPSLSVREVAEGKTLLNCFGGCETERVVAALGLEMKDLFPDGNQSEKGFTMKQNGKIVATYQYHDADGKPVYQVVRYENGDFKARRPNGSSWSYSMDGVERVLYRLPETIKAVATGRVIYLGEGEKDVDRLASLELNATTNPFGADAWKDEYSPVLKGAYVVILQDNDKAGADRSVEVARSLYGVAASIRVLLLPNLPEKGDVSDWLDNGGSKEELRELAAAAEEWREEPVEPATLDEVIATMRRWLYLPDDTPIKAALAAYIANKLEGDPFWLMLVGPASSGKTESIFTMGKLPHLHELSAITSEAALLSGTPINRRSKGTKGGILLGIGQFGVIVIKDFTTILGMRWEDRERILSALREIYDGKYSRDTGSEGGMRLEWSGKVGLIAACTGAIDGQHGFMNLMGPRFCILRMPETDEDKIAAAAIEGQGNEKLMRAEVSEVVRRFMASITIPEDGVEITEDEKQAVILLSAVTAKCRGAVERDRIKRDVENIPGAELPARLARNFVVFLKALRLCGLDSLESVSIMAHVAMDSMPAIRRKALDYLTTHDEWTTTKAIAISAGYPTTTIKRALEDLAIYKVAIRKAAEKKAEDDTDKKSNKQASGNADVWLMSEWTRGRLKAWREWLTRKIQKDAEGDVDDPEGSKNTPQHIEVGFAGWERDLSTNRASSVREDESETSPFADSDTETSERQNVCWSCKNPVDSTIDETCESCGWIRCSCGACSKDCDANSGDQGEGEWIDFSRFRKEPRPDEKEPPPGENDSTVEYNSRRQDVWDAEMIASMFPPRQAP